MRSLLFVLAGLALGPLAACGSISTDPTGGTGTSAAAGTGGAGSTGSTTSATTGTTTGAGGASTSTGTSGTGGGGGCAAPPGAQAFELGTGENCFERLKPLQVVPMMAGPQGGYHVWMAVGCADCGKQATLQYGVKDPMTKDWYAGTIQLSQVVDLTPTGWPEKAGITAFLPGASWQPMSELPKGTHILLSAAVVDANKKPLHQGEIELVLGDTVIWSPPCDPGPNCGAPGGLPCCTDGNFGDGGVPEGGDGG